MLSSISADPVSGRGERPAATGVPNPGVVLSFAVDVGGPAQVCSAPGGAETSRGPPWLWAQTLLLRFLARIPGTEHDEAATRDARRRIIEFFHRYLKGT